MPTHHASTDIPGAPPQRVQSEADRAIMFGLISSVFITVWMPAVLFVRHVLMWFLGISGSNPADVIQLVDWTMWVLVGLNGFLCLIYLDLQMRQTLLRSAVDTQSDWWDTILSMLPLIVFVLVIAFWLAGMIVMHWPEFWIQLLVVLVALWDMRFGRWIQVRVTIRYAHVDESVRNATLHST